MSNLLTGRATVRIDGRVLKSDGAGKLNPGGLKREAKIGPKAVEGYSEEVVPPMLEVTVYHAKDLSLKELNAINDATVEFLTDSGTQFILRGAFVTDAIELDAKSGIALKMSAMSCDEV